MQNNSMRMKLKELLVEQQQQTSSIGGKITTGGSLGKQAFLKDRPPARAARQQLPPLASPSRGSFNNTSLTGSSTAHLQHDSSPVASGLIATPPASPTPRGSSRALNKVFSASDGGTHLPPLQSANDGQSTTQNRKKGEGDDSAPNSARGNHTPPPRASSGGFTVSDSRSVAHRSIGTPPPAQSVAALLVGVSSNIPHISQSESPASSVGPNSLGSVGSSGFSTTNGGAGSPVGAGPLRGDLQQFIEKLSRESKTLPHLNLPRLLAQFLPKVGLENLQDINDGGSISGKSSFSLGSTTDGSNVFLSDSKSQLTPFVSHMTFQSVISDSGDTGDVAQADFQPVNLEGALLFIDISGYSKICTALQGKGAHAISQAVNGYLERILSIVVKQYKGDVLKFAGDAVMVTWTFEADVQRSCMTAAQCALKLQEECGVYPVESDSAEDELEFRLHCGISVGTCNSDVFQPKFSESMQRAYHFVHGAPFSAIEPVVDAAKSGEVCICPDVKSITDDLLETTDLGPAVSHNGMTVFRLERISHEGMEHLKMMELEAAGEDGLEEPLIPDRPNGIEAQFVHPSIVKKLQFGIKAAHLAEMRLLCVLFIHKSNQDASVSDWFYESQEILDAHRCPIVQIIEDDKGVHLVAAVNLFVAEANPTMVGIAAARALKEREVECTIGIATGVTFCGIVGSDLACRWDITGGACVRAARLMQLANKGVTDLNPTGAHIIIDQSLIERCTDFTQLEEVSATVVLKGSPEPVTIYTLSESTNSVTTRILRGEELVNQVLSDTFETMVENITYCMTTYGRAIGVITGAIGSGKKSTALRVGMKFGCTSILHQGTRGAPGLSVADTLASWYEHHTDPEISELAVRIKTSFRQHFVSRTLHLCLELVDLTLSKDISTCLIVHHAQFLDNYSLSLLYQIHGSMVMKGELAPTSQTAKWATMLTHYPLYGSPSALKLAQAVSHAKCGGDVSIVPMNRYDTAQQHFLFQSGIYIFKPGGVAAFVNYAGHNLATSFAAGGYMGKCYFENIAKAKATGNPPIEFSKVDIFGRGEILKRGEEAISTTPWTIISPEVVSRVTQLFDVLPPRHQMVLKVIAAVTRQDVLFEAPVSVVSQITLQLVSKRSAKEITHDVKLLSELLIVDYDEVNSTVSFTNPAMRDMVDSLLTPDQVQTINRRCAQLYMLPPFYKEGDSLALLALARFLRHSSGPHSADVLSTPSAVQYKEFLWKAWTIGNTGIQDMETLSDLDRYEQFVGCAFCNQFQHELQYVKGLGTLESLGVPTSQVEKFSYWFANGENNFATYALAPSLDPTIVDAKNYAPPLSLGPIAVVLAKISAGITMRYFLANRLAAGMELGMRMDGQTYEELSSHSFDMIPVYFAGLERFEEIVPAADQPLNVSTLGRSGSQVIEVNQTATDPAARKLEVAAELAKERQLLEGMLAPGQSGEAYVKHAKAFLTDYAVNVVAPRAARAATWLSSPEVHLPPLSQQDPFEPIDAALNSEAALLEHQNWAMRRAFDCLTVQVKKSSGSGTFNNSRTTSRVSHIARSPNQSSSGDSAQSLVLKLELQASKFHESLMCLAVESWTPRLPLVLANAPQPPVEGDGDALTVTQKLKKLEIISVPSMVEKLRDSYLKSKTLSLEQYRAFLYLYCTM